VAASYLRLAVIAVLRLLPRLDRKLPTNPACYERVYLSTFSLRPDRSTVHLIHYNLSRYLVFCRAASAEALPREGRGNVQFMVVRTHERSVLVVKENDFSKAVCRYWYRERT
jgi:hypothetical protein